MRSVYKLIFAAAFVSAPSMLLAHGPQIGIIVSNNKLVTGALLENENSTGNYAPAGTVLPGYVPPYTSNFSAKSVYAIPLVQFGNQYRVRPSQSTVAGYDAGPGLGFFPSDLAGRTISATFTGSLSLWNGSDWQDPGDEQLRGFRNVATNTPTYAYTGDASQTGAVQWLVGAGNHGGATWVLGTGEGSANFSAVDASQPDTTDNGVYRVSIQYSVTGSPTIDPTAVTFLLYKNVSQTVAQSAADSLGVDPSLVQVIAVPEPIAALILPAAMLIRRRR